MLPEILVTEEKTDHMERKSTEIWITQKIQVGKERGNSYQKNEEISRQKAHTNTRKLNSNVSMITDIFLDQNKVNFR